MYCLYGFVFLYWFYLNVKSKVMKKDIEILVFCIVYKNKWLIVREDKIVRMSGKEGFYGVVEKFDFVIILLVYKDIIYFVE